MNRKTNLKSKLAACAATVCLATFGHSAAEPVSSTLPHPLREPSITHTPDLSAVPGTAQAGGTYFLTGTDGAPAIAEYGPVSFTDNDGIRLWKSTDLQQWEPVGKVFDIVTWGEKEGFAQPWWRYITSHPQAPAFSLPTRGVYSPSLYFIKGKPCILFTISGMGAGLLESENGRPEGPYRLLVPKIESKLQQGSGDKMRPLLYEADRPSLFEDVDGSVHILWGDGLMAPLTDDLTTLAGEPKRLRCAPDPATPDYPFAVGDRGYRLFLHGRYLLAAVESTVRDGRTVAQVFVAESDAAYGPYGARRSVWSGTIEPTVVSLQDGQLAIATAARAEDEAATTTTLIVENIKL